MKNKLISIAASFFLLLTSQLGFTAEGAETEDDKKKKDDVDSEQESTGGAAGAAAASNATGGIALGTVAAIAAIAAAV
mgnify:FL=1